LEKKIADKISEQKIKKREEKRRDQDKLNIHLLCWRKQLNGMLKNKIKLGSTMHGML